MDNPVRVDTPGVPLRPAGYRRRGTAEDQAVGKGREDRAQPLPRENVRAAAARRGFRRREGGEERPMIPAAAVPRLGGRTFPAQEVVALIARRVDDGQRSPRRAGVEAGLFFLKAESD